MYRILVTDDEKMPCRESRPPSHIVMLDVRTPIDGQKLARALQKALDELEDVGYEASSRKGIVEMVMEAVRCRYAENLTIKQVAAAKYVDETYLGRLFKAAAGEPFHAYLNRIRIEKAGELLLSTDACVYEICQSVGYKSLDYFRRQFKTITGLNPKEYRQARSTLLGDLLQHGVDMGKHVFIEGNHVCCRTPVMRITGKASHYTY